MLSSAIALPLQYQNEIKVKMLNYLNYLLNRDLENLAKATMSLWAPTGCLRAYSNSMIL